MVDDVLCGTGSLPDNVSGSEMLVFAGIHTTSSAKGCRPTLT